MSKEYFAPLRMASFPHDIWMSIWDAYGDPCVPLFPEDILHPVTPVMVPSTLVEISPPNSCVDSAYPISAIDVSNSV